MDDVFFQSLSRGTIMLTANRRLASDLQYQYARYQRSQKKHAWITPSILPLSAWLPLLWGKIDNKRTLLSSVQESCLWKAVSQQNWASIPTVQQAWETLQRWDMAEEAQSIFQWADDFRIRCEENQWITAAEIPQALLMSEAWIDYLPESIFLVGFDDFPPIISMLFQKIEEHCSVQHIKTEDTNANVTRFECDDTESELYTMATWAQKEYHNNPSKKIACVIPNLTQIRQVVVRVFSTIFPDSSVFNVSAGQHLNEFLIVETALQILRGKWEGLLQLPYLTQSDDDKDLGALVDTMRRRNNLLHFDANDLLPFFTSLQARFPQSTYLKRWNRLFAFKKTIPKSQTLGQWIYTFTEILQILQWPGTRTLNSTELQVLQRWLKAQEELIACDAIFNVMNHEQALTILNHHISHIIFQPKSEHAAIQILGVLETAGLSFDAMWVMGLDNERWPPPASPNPFLPYALQIQRNMPHASAERELQFTQHTLQRLLASAKELYLSSPKTDGDRQLASSQLIQSFPLSSETKPRSECSNNVSQNAMENISDTLGLPLSNNENTKGGTAVLKYQATCPFKAYARFRLAADPLETPALGLSPSLRGQLLHQVLELIWKRIQSQDQLLAMQDHTLNETISRVINEIMETQSLNQSDKIFLNVEKKRLQKIIQEWLTIEKERSPFTVIAQESERHITIGSLSFRCRTDRIDQLENGAQLIIDYKSGYSSLQDCFTARPPEPQLPIYCVFNDGKAYDGIAFAQVRAGAMQFKGIMNEQYNETHDDGIVSISEFDNPDDIHHWNTLTAHWKNNLEKIAQAFYQGHAAVDPLESACDYCELQPLCRVNECQT